MSLISYKASIVEFRIDIFSSLYDNLQVVILIQSSRVLVSQSDSILFRFVLSAAYRNMP